MKINNVSLINQLSHPKIILQSISHIDTELRSAEHYFSKMSDEFAEKITYPNDLIKMSKSSGTPQEILINATKWKLKRMTELAIETNYRKLVLSDKTYKNLSNYKVPKDIRIGVLRTLPNRKDIIQLNQGKVIRYIKTDTLLSVEIIMLSNSSSTIDSYFFCIDLVDGLSYYNNYDGLISEAKGTVKEGLVIHDIENDNKHLSYENMVEKYYSQFMICVTYLELTDVTFDICYSNTRRGNIMRGNDLKNESSYNIIQVNTNWNITKLHIGDTFDVTGHWRLQPYGVGRAKYKYIFIDTYEKTGIIKRKAGKEIHTKP